MLFKQEKIIREKLLRNRKGDLRKSNYISQNEDIDEFELGLRGLIREYVKSITGEDERK